MRFSRTLCNCCIWSCGLTALYMRINLFLSTNPPPQGCLQTLYVGLEAGAGKQPWGRQMPFRTLRLLEVPPLLPSPSSGGVLDLLGYPRTSPVTDSRDLGVDGRYRGLSMGQRLWTGKGELRG